MKMLLTVFIYSLQSVIGEPNSTFQSSSKANYLLYMKGINQPVLKSKISWKFEGNNAEFKVLSKAENISHGILVKCKNTQYFPLQKFTQIIKNQTGLLRPLYLADPHLGPKKK